jgi:hypothetical protein
VPGHEIVGRSLKDGSAVTTFSRAISRRLTPGGVDKGKKIGVAGLAGPGHTAVKIAHVFEAQVVVFTTSLVMITNASVALRSPSAVAFVWRIWRVDWRVLLVTEFSFGLFWRHDSDQNPGVYTWL